MLLLVRLTLNWPGIKERAYDISTAPLFRKVGTSCHVRHVTLQFSGMPNYIHPSSQLTSYSLKFITSWLHLTYCGSLKCHNCICYNSPYQTCLMCVCESSEQTGICRLFLNGLSSSLTQAFPKTKTLKPKTEYMTYIERR